MLNIKYEGKKRSSADFGEKILRRKIKFLDIKEEIWLRVCDFSSELEEQEYHLTQTENFFTLISGGEAGLMYGLIDLSFLLCRDEWKTEGKIYKRKPYIKNRGIKFNIPLDARTPSYSDASDSAFYNIPHVWEKAFWEEFLDNMAENKYNMLSLWSLSPFPSMVKIPEYPRTALDDVMRSVIAPKPEMNGDRMYTLDMDRGMYPIKKISIEEKVKFWKWVMNYAKERCISVYIFIWNLFVYGTEQSGYRITDDQRNPVTEDYIYCGVKALFRTYPDLRGIGVTAGEHMEGNGSDISFIRRTYGRAIEECLKEDDSRKIELIHRTQYACYPEIMEEFSGFKGEFSLSFKYSQAHMYSDTRPAFFEDFLKKYPEGPDYWLTLRDDDHYFLRWGNLDYVKEYLEHVPKERVKGFYMGADGFTWGRDYTKKNSLRHPLYMEKMWYKFMLWGILAYNPEEAEDIFTKEWEYHTGKSGKELKKALEMVSNVIPLLNQIHWHDYDFQWYPEACCMLEHPPVGKLVFADILEFMDCPSMPKSGYLSVRDYSICIKNKEHCGKKNPKEAAEKMIFFSAKSLEELKKISDHSPSNLGEEAIEVIEDIKAMAYLGEYYGCKIQAAICLYRFRLSENIKGREQAVQWLKQASCIWKKYSSEIRKRYTPQRLSRLCDYIDMQRFDRCVDLDIELAQKYEFQGIYEKRIKQ